MVNSFNLTVRYFRRKSVFFIEPTMTLNHIICLISNTFRIKSNEFLVEINDTRFDMLIVLNNSYFDELRSHPYFAENRSLFGQIRLRHSSSSEIKLDTDLLPTCMLSENAIEPDDIIVWLDPYISHVEDYIPLRHYFGSITAVDAPELLSVKSDRDIYNLIRASYNFKCDESYYKNYTIKILRTFSESDECLEFIQAASALKKKIFIISSSTLVQKLIPYVLDNKNIYSIYTLFDFMSPLEELVHYSIEVSCILSFEFERDLLTRLTRDIAAYYEDKSSNNTNPNEKLSYLRWARKLYVNATINDQQFTSFNTERHFESRINELEHYLDIYRQNQDEFQWSVECVELLRVYI